MDFKTLLDDAGWENSEFSYDDAALEAEISKKTQRPVARVLNNSKRSLILNGLFFVGFGLIYVIFPRQLVLLPVLLITGCYLVMLISIIYGMVNLPKPNMNQNIKSALQEVLDYDRAINSFQCRFFALIITVAFIGGFILGLGLQGWTYAKLFDKWPVFIVMAVAAVGMYYLANTKALRSFNRKMNPNYFKSKNFIKQQLEHLNNDSDENQQ